MKRQKLFFVSALSMMLACSSACNDGMEGQDAPPEADAPAVCDANTLELTSDEMTILRTMDGSSPKISQDEAISIAAKFLDKNQLSKSTSGVRCDVVTRKRSSISKQGAPESSNYKYGIKIAPNIHR